MVLELNGNEVLLTLFISFLNHDAQLSGVELLAHGVQNGCHSVGLDEASFALIEHGKGLLQHYSTQTHTTKLITNPLFPLETRHKCQCQLCDSNEFVAILPSCKMYKY